MLIFLAYKPFPSLKQNNHGKKNVVTLVTLSHFENHRDKSFLFLVTIQSAKVFKADMLCPESSYLYLNILS